MSNPGSSCWNGLYWHVTAYLLTVAKVSQSLHGAAAASGNAYWQPHRRSGLATLPSVGAVP